MSASRHLINRAHRQTTAAAISKQLPGQRLRVFCLATALLAFLATPTLAQGGSERVPGVANFGRVTDKYFRGGEVTKEGLKNLAALGVRTVIDLREEADEDEAAACKELGIAYHSFPMTTEDTPAAGHVEKIVALIEQATAPVYVHCSGGKHRTGTVCAYFRIKRQGQSAEKAWREQQSYGFGTPEEHANLFVYIYGDTPVASKLKPLPAAPTAAAPATVESNGAAATPSVASQPTATAPAHPAGVLSPTVAYISTARAVELTRSYGGAGETVRVNLEYDKKNAAPVWKVLQATGAEYRLHAQTGALLGTKSKAEKLGYLNPLAQPSKYWTFQQVIAKAEKRGKAKVVEMELKSIRGRNQTFFEVMMADGVTLFFEAANGKQIRAF